MKRSITDKLAIYWIELGSLNVVALMLGFLTFEFADNLVDAFDWHGLFSALYMFLNLPMWPWLVIAICVWSSFVMKNKFGFVKDQHGDLRSPEDGFGLDSFLSGWFILLLTIIIPWVFFFLGLHLSFYVYPEYPIDFH